MRQAIFAAIDTFKRRKEYQELREKPIRKEPKLSESLEAVANESEFKEDTEG
jgi:hypothetical protein